MHNPYQPSEPSPPLVDHSRRPLGVTILAILTGALGLLLLAMYIVSLANWQENNAHFVARRIAPSIFWVIGGSFTFLMLASSIGAWRGAKWSQWIVCSALVMYALQNIGTAASIALRSGASTFDIVPLLSLMLSLALSVVFTLLVVYWRSLGVRKYFQFETAGGIVAIALSGLAGIGIVIGITLFLQTLFLIST